VVQDAAAGAVVVVVAGAVVDVVGVVVVVVGVVVVGVVVVGVVVVGVVVVAVVVGFVVVGPVVVATVVAAVVVAEQLGFVPVGAHTPWSPGTVDEHSGDPAGIKKLITKSRRLSYVTSLRDTAGQAMEKSGGMPANIQNARVPQSEQYVPASRQLPSALKLALNAKVSF
jgi:hypothetical protein